MPGPSHLQCVKALERIQVVNDKEEANADLLRDTMLVTTRVFGHAREAGTATLLEGIAAFLVENRKLKQFDQDRLIEQLKQYPGQAFGLIGDARPCRACPRCAPRWLWRTSLSSSTTRACELAAPVSCRHGVGFGKRWGAGSPAPHAPVACSVLLDGAVAGSHSTLRPLLPVEGPG